MKAPIETVQGKMIALLVVAIVSSLVVTFELRSGNLNEKIQPISAEDTNQQKTEAQNGITPYEISAEKLETAELDIDLYTVEIQNLSDDTIEFSSGLQFKRLNPSNNIQQDSVWNTGISSAPILNGPLRPGERRHGTIAFDSSTDFTQLIFFPDVFSESFKTIL